VAVSDQVGGLDGLDDTSAAVLELAESIDAPVALQLWGPEGRLDSSTAHVELLAAELATDIVRIDDVPVRTDDVETIEAAAGPLVAW
jgi:hypothetical protein